MLFSKGFWEKFGDFLFRHLYIRIKFKHRFNSKIQDVKVAANYWKSEEEELSQIIADNSLQHNQEHETVKNIMRWVNKNFPPETFYKSDKSETWNTPLQTLRTWWDEEDYTTDCDDYAILIYSLCRVAGVSEDNLYLSFVEAFNEGFHLNVMYFYKNTPYAVEGTFLPQVAEKGFLKTPYSNLSCKVYSFEKRAFSERLIFKKIWYIFNENGSFKKKIH